MIKRLTLCILASIGIASAQTTNQQVSVTLTATNTPVTGNSLTLNGDVRLFTNATTVATILTNLVNPVGAMSNVFSAVALYPFTATSYRLQYLSSTQLVFQGAVGQAMSMQVTGTWATVSFATNTLVETKVVRVPMSVFTSAAQSSVGSGLVEYLGQATNLLLRLESTNAVLDRPTFTNGVNYGASLSSPSTAGGTSWIAAENFGSGAVASNDYALAVGAGALALQPDTTAIGHDAVARGEYSVAVGTGVDAGGDWSLSIGAVSSALGERAIAIGKGAAAGHADSIAIGTGVTTTTSNEVRIGVADNSVVMPGKIQLPSRTWTSLANGNNSGVPLGTNSFVELSGATTIARLCGFAAGAADEIKWVRISGAVTNTIANESGDDPSAANRIITGTGGDVFSTNNPSQFQLRYRAASSRWELLNLR